MKSRITLSLIWILVSFLLLSWVLYAVNDYQSRMLGAVTGQPGAPPTLERAKKLEAKLREAKNMDEARAIMDQIGDDIAKYLSIGSASVAFDAIVQRVWILWGASAIIALLFLWWPVVSSRWTATLSGGPPVAQDARK